ncbi:Golgi apparatus membrane protein TVP18 [Microthyrium microscopicum]|uniref:Golgi apparatus membrane protein TVP18 n=1 Tax=Microthyrium microscopicum TaxID=703497 RepID=A0A6A6UQ64_9PEZI|nr:Golgi apparatus membrane protein TVP18 [Microthyrium microscopicum]
MTIADEFRTRNWSIYAQWSGIITMILCFAVGLANVIIIIRPLLVIFAALCLATSFMVLFIEVPLLLRICPTSQKFDGIIRRFSTNYMRAGIYIVLSVVQWLSLIFHQSSLIAAAIFLFITGALYGVAALRKDEFMSSKTLGGQGVAQMIV